MAENSEDDIEPDSPISPTSPTKAFGLFKEKVTRSISELVETIGTEDRKALRRTSSMRSYGQQQTFRNGGTLLEKGLGTFTEAFTQRSIMTLSSMKTDRTLNSNESMKKAVIKRRGEEAKPPTIWEVLDNHAEQIIKSSVEQPWFLESCMAKDDSYIQRLCHPAEYATRHRRDELEHTASGMGADDRRDKMYGLPEWDKAGYSFLPFEESSWVDERVPMRLGLQLAVHRKTSVERLCLQQHKAKLPSGISKDQFLTVVRNLKRCDHVNVLRCHEVCEDESCVYFVYENFPCVTLLSVLEVQQWTQEQIANLVRECCAAVAFATTVGLFHLGWTLCHVLLPVTSLTGDPMVAKVYGFGLMGNIHLECSDRMCWAPEALETWLRIGDSFLLRMETSMKSSCDLWSLGIIIYTLVARRPPIMGSAESLNDMIISRKWAFTLAFDEVDREAKSLIEGLLEGNFSKRIDTERALRNAWIRRRWRPPPHRARTFSRLEEFCNAPLAKRLFGRFLVRFLDAEHMRQIAHSFYSLDSQGDGVICGKDLSACAKACGRPPHAVQTITEWMFAESPGSSISLSRFAECMAESVIDGRALRHAFESLDDDGSECISAEELFCQLRTLDESLTFEQILEHIEAAEDEIQGHVRKEKENKDEMKDAKLDFEEFVHLFPVRLKRMKLLQERTDANHQYAELSQQLFQSVQMEAHQWLKQLQAEISTVDKLSGLVVNKDEAEQAVKDLKKRFFRISEYLRHPPGPYDAKTMGQLMQGVKAKTKAQKRNSRNDMYGFDSFMQDQAIKEYWAGLIVDEMRLLRQSVMKNAGNNADIDHFKVHDAAETAILKLDLIIEWTRSQLEEYESFVEVLADIEAPMPTMTLSSRGLQHHGEDEQEREPS